MSITVDIVSGQGSEDNKEQRAIESTILEHEESKRNDGETRVKAPKVMVAGKASYEPNYQNYTIRNRIGNYT